MEKNEQKIEVGDVVRLKSDREHEYTVGETCADTRRRIYGHQHGSLVSYEVDERILVKV